MRTVQRLWTSTGRSVTLRPHATAISADGTLTVWTGRAVTLFPLDIHDMVDDGVLAQLRDADLVVTDEDLDVVRDVRSAISDRFTRPDEVVRLLDVANPGDVLELAAPTTMVADRLSRRIDRLSPDLRVGDGVPVRCPRYDAAVLAQRPMWPVRRRSAAAALVDGVAAGLEPGGWFIASVDTLRWRDACHAELLSAPATARGYRLRTVENRLTGVVELRLCGETGSGLIDVAVVETVMPFDAWSEAVFNDKGVWSTLRWIGVGLSEEQEFRVGRTRYLMAERMRT